MTACGSIGALMVGGRVVGQLKCELEAGHDIGHDDVCYCGSSIEAHYDREHNAVPGPAPTPHRVVLEWADTEPVDLDLFDPAEHFDVDVPIPEAPVPFTSVYRAEAERRVIGLGGTSFEPAPLDFPPTYLDRADLYGEE